MERARGLTRRLATLAGLCAALLLPAALHGCADGAVETTGAAGTAPRGMVVASQSDAARAGAALLEAGGNAVDAAVATAFALAVTQPFSAGLGGGCFVLVRLADGSVFAVDARETAPAAAERDMYLRPGVAADASLLGPLAVATPGFVAGLALAQERWGAKAWREVLAPAIRLAEEGFAIGPYHARMLGHLAKRGLFERFPETARIQLEPTGDPPRPGARIVQRDMARTLRRIAKDGSRAFYEGPIAEAIAAEMERRGGLVTLGDLEGYRPKLRGAVRGSYRGLELISFPPPSSGGAILVEMLNVLEGFDLAAQPPDAPDTAHRVAEAMKLAFADRAAWLGDPDFVPVPVERLTAKDYAAGLRARIDTSGNPDSALEVRGPGLPAEDAGTTHLSTADAAGNAVALTMTINTPFGSGITVRGTGIVLNNEMDDFARAPDTPNVYGLVDTRGANAIAPGKRPLSSMTPTIVLRGGELFMVTGSPGGPRIITTTLHTILNVVDFGMNVREAVAAPRYHHQWVPDKVFAEPDVSPELVDGLRKRGHEVEVAKRTWSSAQAIVVDAATGHFAGGSDPRGDGAAVGF
jgi:gamma-glutamyltranspeptidase/glutathione hydrolase